MKKLFSAVLSAIFIISATTISAQTSADERDYHSTFQVSFFPPLSTNGLHSGRYTNDISLNLLAGVSKNERAFALAGLGNIIRNDATGLQFAGMVNYVGGEGRGVQFGGIANIGLGDLTGLQFGGLANSARDVKGFQFGGIANVARGAKGFQFGGIVNVARDVKGFQFGGITNVARDVKGFQFGGIANIARDVEGVQFGGLVNVAKRVHGVQFSGIVNIAEKSDYPFGIVNIVKEGEMGVAVGYNEIGTTSLTFRSGGRVLYGIIGLGYNHRVASKRAFSIIGGYGAHINILPWLRINNEITTETLGIFSERSSTFKTGYALLPAFRPVRWVEIFGGPSINYMFSADEDRFGAFPKNSFWEKERTRRSGGRTLQKAFVGWQAGVQFIF